MRNTRLLAHAGFLSGLTVLVALIATAPHSGATSGAGRCSALAELAEQIISCSTHPCLGDSVKSVREAVNDAIVSDDTFYYSDLEVAYPSVRGTLQGLVDWDLDGHLESISLKITDFHADRSVLLAEMELMIPGCVMEGDEEGDEPDEQADEEIPTDEWECSAGGEGSAEVELFLYFAPGLVMLELYQ